MNAKGHLVVNNDNANDIGGLGSAIKLGFGPEDKVSTASATSTSVAPTPGKSSNGTIGILGFTGERSRRFDLFVMANVWIALGTCIVYI